VYNTLGTLTIIINKNIFVFDHGPVFYLNNFNSE